MRRVCIWVVGFCHHNSILQMQESGPSQKYIQANRDNHKWYCIHHFAARISGFEQQVLHLLSGSQIFAPNHP